jgi:heptosyltransferase-2
MERGSGTPPGSRTLVIGVNWLGDTLMSLPALHALRQLFPRETIHIIIPNHLVALYRMVQAVDEACGWPGGGSISQRIHQVKRGRYQRVILFPNSFRSAWIAWRSRIPERWGYAGQLRRWLLNRPVELSARTKEEHQSQHYMELIRTMGYKGDALPPFSLCLPDEASSWADGVIEPCGDTGPLIGICAGAMYGPAKRWPPEGFAEVGRELCRRHDAKIILIGDRREQRQNQLLATMIPNTVVDLSGRTDIQKLAAVLARCDLVISNDSGPMHLAAFLSRPVVGLFGSTDPALTGPLGTHRILRSQIECSPCFKRECPEGSYRCLAEIKPDRVLRAAEELLQHKAAAQGQF